MFSLKNVRTQPLSPQGRLVVKLDFQQILHVHLRYIIHNVPGVAVVKENRDYKDFYEQHSEKKGHFIQITDMRVEQKYTSRVRES